MDDDMAMAVEAEHDALVLSGSTAESFNRMLQCGYKDVQAMAVHRKLPANLKKVEMCRLIALYDAGAEVELEHLLSGYRETRHRSRRAHSSASASPTSSSYRGYVTAEADSASAIPDLDDDDDFISTPVEDDGDEDYEPGSKRKSAKKVSGLGAAGRGSLGSLGLEEPPKGKKPSYRRPSGSSSRVSKTGRLIKPRHDSSYVYSSKVSHASNVVPYPMAPTPSPAAYRQGMSVDGNAYDSAQGALQATVGPFRAPAPYGHSVRPGSEQTFCAPSNTKQYYNNYPMKAPASYGQSFLHSSAHQTYGGSCNSNNFHNNYQQSQLTKEPEFSYVPSSAEPQLEGNYPLPPAADNFDIKPTFYPPINNNYVNTPMCSDIVSSTQVVKPISLPAVPSNDSPTNGYISANLEWFYNVKSENLHMPLQLSPYWKPANTNSVNSYITPISFTSCGPGLYQEATHTPMKPLYHINSSYEESAFQPLMKPVQKPFSSYPNLNYNMNQNNVLQANAQPKQFVSDARPYPQALPMYEINQPHQVAPVPFQGPSQLQPVQGPHSPYEGSLPMQGPPTSYQLKTKQMKPQQVHQRQVVQQRRRQMQYQLPQYQSHQTVRQSNFPKPDRRVNPQYVNGSHQQQQRFSHKPQHQHSMQQGTSKGQTGPPSSFQPQQLVVNQNHSPYQQQVPYQPPPQQDPVVQTPISYQAPLAEQLVQKPSLAAQESEQMNTPQLPFSEFRGQNHELSYPLIYDYLTSTEKQLSSLKNIQESIVKTKSSNVEYSSTPSNCVAVNIATSREDGLSSKLKELPNENRHVAEIVDSTPTCCMQIPAEANNSVIIEPENVSSKFSEPPPLLVEPEKPSYLVDTTLEKVVKEDENTKQVVFLCNDGMGDIEYMTLSVSQDDVLNTSAISTPETAPVTPCVSDVGMEMDCNNNEVTHVMEEVSSLISSHPSQISTIPVTNSDVSTETASSISDYMSSQQTMDQTSSDMASINDRSVETSTSSGIVTENDSSGVRISDTMSLQVLDNSLFLKEESVPQLEDKTSTEEELSACQKTEGNISDPTKLRPAADPLELQAPVTSGEAQDMSVQDLTVRTLQSGVSFEEKPDDVDETKAVKDTDNIKVVVEIKEVNDILMEPLNLMQPPGIKEEAFSASSTSSLSEDNDSSGSSDLALPAINMNIMRQLSTECSVVLENVVDLQGEKSPLQTVTDCRPAVDAIASNAMAGDVMTGDAMHTQGSPLLRSRSVGGKTYPGKQALQARQPVRCSPRTASRTGPRPSYSLLMPLSLSPQPHRDRDSEREMEMPLRVESAMQQPAKVWEAGRKPCPNADHGCLLVLPPAQLSSHHLVCEYSFIECPAIGCAWKCIAKKLCTHIREAHRAEIGSGTDSMHTISIHEIRQQQCLAFLREVSRKLFVVCIHAFGNSIFASIQFIASGRAEKPVSATGTLEVIDFAGTPHAWRGKIGLIQQPLHTVRENGNCLKVPSECLGNRVGPEATITFHTNIRVNLSMSQIQVQSPSISDPLS